MKIAVPYDNNNIFQHFGHTEYFKVYNIENGNIVYTELIGTMGMKGHTDLVYMLAMMDIDAVICGNIGINAQELLEDEGITLYSNCIGNVDEAVNALIFGDMIFEFKSEKID